MTGLKVCVPYIALLASAVLRVLVGRRTSGRLSWPKVFPYGTASPHCTWNMVRAVWYLTTQVVHVYMRYCTVGIGELTVRQKPLRLSDVGANLPQQATATKRVRPLMRSRS